MSLSIQSNASALSLNGLTLPFSATGGTAPYTWTVAPGGAGGSINSSTGLYTSPANTGVDEVVVTDSLLASTEFALSVCTPIELVCDILQTQLGLSPGQVYLWNQKINIPTDSSLYIAVGVLSCKPFANDISYKSVGGGLNQVQTSNFQAILTIDILSRGPAARDKKELVLMALASQYAESQMELNSFFVAPLTTSFINLSEIDGAAIPYRFQLQVAVQYFISNTVSVPFYTTFQTPSVTPNP